MFEKLKKFKNLFFVSEEPSKPESDSNIKNPVRKSSIAENVNGKRFLMLDNQDCALLLHENNQCEVVFTKLYNKESQDFTPNEQLLMSLAIFLKQPGFGDMLVSEFHRVAANNSQLFKSDEKENKENKENKEEK